MSRQSVDVTSRQPNVTRTLWFNWTATSRLGLREDESGDNLVSVQLDDEESCLNFIDVPGAEAASRTRDSSRRAVDAHLVVYSVTDRASFVFAQSCLQDLRPAKRHNVVILVANKQDLVRNRVIFEEDGKNVATKRHCKFIEVSALLNHRMEELLVGTLRQIRLRRVVNADGHQKQQVPDDVISSADRTASSSAGLGCLQRAAIVIARKLFQRPVTRTSSCDDLFQP